MTLRSIGARRSVDTRHLIAPQVERRKEAKHSPRAPALPPSVSRGALPRTTPDMVVRKQLLSMVARLGNAELSEVELIRIRSQLRGLNQAELGELRKTLDRTLPRWRKARVPEAMRGPVSLDKVMEILGGPQRLGRLARATKEELRAVREVNLDAVLLRAAIRLVNGNSGVYRMFNRGDADHPQGLPISFRGRSLDSVDQRRALVDEVAGLLRVGFTEEQALEVCRAAAAEAVHGLDDPQAIADSGYRAVIETTAARVTKRSTSFEAMPCPANVDRETKATIAHRLSQVRWMEAGIVAEAPGFETGCPAEYREDIQSLLLLPDAEAMMERLDARYERAMNAVYERTFQARSFEPLATVRIERLPADHRQVAIDTARDRLPESHVVRVQLRELRERLERGERTAIGLSYATNTFPKRVLDRVASGELGVVAFDGSREAGIEYIRNAYGVDKGVRASCRLTGIQGVYGSYARTLVTLDSGRELLLLSGYGASRQLNNAATLLLYQDARGNRLRLENIDLATDHTDFEAMAKRLLLDGLKNEWGDRKEAMDAIPTRLMILQNPAHLAHLLGKDLRWSKDHDPGALFRIAYRRHPDGHEERLIIPKVGGGGLYGDTAGQFISAFFGMGLKNLVPDVFFNGAAGGFADTADLPSVEPGGLIMPIGQVAEYGDPRGALPMPLMLDRDPSRWPRDVREAVKRSGVHLTNKHVAVMAPAIETFPLVHELVSRGFASVDVEAAAVIKAARKCGVTVTVVYTHSDDPRASETNPNAAFGMVASFLEGSHYNEKLFDLLRALWDYSDRRFMGSSSSFKGTPSMSAPMRA